MKSATIFQTYCLGNAHACAQDSILSCLWVLRSHSLASSAVAFACFFFSGMMISTHLLHACFQVRISSFRIASVLDCIMRVRFVLFVGTHFCRCYFRPCCDLVIPMYVYMYAFEILNCGRIVVCIIRVGFLPTHVMLVCFRVNLSANMACIQYCVFHIICM